jgi:hypothetical protein
LPAPDPTWPNGRVLGMDRPPPITERYNKVDLFTTAATCRVCGALVWDCDLHDQFHASSTVRRTSWDEKVRLYEEHKRASVKAK